MLSAIYTKGDQPEDIHDQTRNLTMKYIESDNTFILVVTPATVDLETCEALQLAKTVDPEGVRTLGVITKPDVREDGGDGSSLVKILQNRVYQRRLGYIAVKNRTKRQTDEGVTAWENLQVRISFS